MGVTETFRQHASGLYVPDVLSREREVWTHDEWRVIDRATKLLRKRGLDFKFACRQPACAKSPIDRVDPLDGGMVLRCAHKDRVFTRAF